MKNRQGSVKKAGPTESRPRAMYMVLKVDESGQLLQQVQVMGYKGNTHVKNFVERNSETLQALADTVLGASVKESQPQTRGMEDEDANAWVKQIVYDLGKLKGNSGLKNSYIQGPLKIVMRLVLGQLLAAVLRELDEDAQYIGCAPEVLVAGKNVLKGIDKIVNGNKGIDKIGKGKPTGSRSSSSLGRPEIKDFLLNGVQAMCKQAKTVQCRASITSFMCALCFSIMKGEKADHVDAWQLSSSKSDSVAERGRQGGREGEEIEASDVGDTKKQEWEKCGSRRFLKGFSVESQKQMLHESLLAVRDGGFWLMPHWNQFADGESFTALGDAFLPEQVFDYVRLQDEAAATSGNVYKNRFTNLECKEAIAEVQGKMTIAEVQGMFQAPDRHGLKWIPIDVAVITKALGLAFENVADAHMKTSSARSDDEASSTDEHLAGAAKTKSKKALTINELLEEVLAFLLAMSVRQQCTGGAKDKGSSSTHITNSCVKVSIPTPPNVSIPTPVPSPPPQIGDPGGRPGERTRVMWMKDGLLMTKITQMPAFLYVVTPLKQSSRSVLSSQGFWSFGRISSRIHLKFPLWLS